MAETTATMSARPVPSEGHIKETIESILVAFILAFVFRAFIVEAFVIPTGSMAPTLLGAHMRLKCADCGYEWAVNYSSGTANDENIPSSATLPDGRPIVYDGEGRLPQHQPRLVCPNCGYPVAREAATAPPVNYGDRILVMKYLYRFQEPRRWDVVVFKAPLPSATPDPNQAEFAQNYIKRLVGKPGESILILDGDIYVGQRGAARETFQIQRKPAYAQDALWRNVFDNDYLPHLERPDPQWRQPWSVVDGSGWDLGVGTKQRTFHFDNAGGGGSIDYDPAASPATWPLTDWLAYDEVFEGINAPREKPPVSDLKLAFYYQRSTGDGPLQLELGKGVDTFTAEVTPGHVALIRTRDGQATTLRPAITVNALAGSTPAFLEFSNVDYRVSLRINGSEVFATEPGEYVPDVGNMLQSIGQGNWTPPQPKVRVTASRQTCAIEHLKLSRDIYYLNGYPRGSANASSLSWGTPNKVVDLGPDEFFVLGDNSLISGDARTWVNPVSLPDEDLEVAAGRVPRRFMLGKAFFVYWPAGYRPMQWAPGLVPNFGEMRFIH